jgi:hypothetical protein
MPTPKNLDELLEDNREIKANTTFAPASVEPVDEFTENEKELIAKRVYTPEQLRAVKGFDATKGVALEHYIKTFQKPELDEKALQRNRTVGILGDGIKLLGQMYGAHKGARIDKAEPGGSLTSYFAKREDEARNMYQKRLDEWKRGYYGAQMSDVQTKNSYYTTLNNNLRADLKDLEGVKRHEKERAEDIERANKQYEDEKAHRDRVFEETVNQNKIQNTQKNRETALREKSIGNNKKEDKTEIARYVARAVMNEDFVKDNPGLFKAIKLKGFGNVETTRGTNQPAVDASVIAQAYLLWLAKNPSSGTAVPTAPVYYPWLHPYQLGGNGIAPETSPLAPVDKVTRNSNSKPKFTF